MYVEKNEIKAMSLTVTDGLTVTILPDQSHEFLMGTREVANGYGTTAYAIRQAMSRNTSEFIEGKHIVKGCDILSNPHEAGVKIQPHQVFWTKRGIVRLGFFIKSERAKLFRDWAEELVIDAANRTDAASRVTAKAMPSKRTKANRLTAERLLSIMADVARIDDRDIRLSITDKLMNGGING